MNRQRRATLRHAQELLSSAAKIVEMVKDEEQESLDNYPENMQDSDRCKVMEDAVDHLDDALSAIQEAEDCIDNAMGG